jgi:chromosome segregation ATPase
MEMDDRVFVEFSKELIAKIDYTNRKITTIDEDIKSMGKEIKEMATKLGAVVTDTSVHKNEIEHLNEDVRRSADREQRERETLWREIEKLRAEASACRGAEDMKTRDLKQELKEQVKTELRSEARGVKAWALAAFWTGLIGFCAAAGAIAAVIRAAQKP